MRMRGIILQRVAAMPSQEAKLAMRAYANAAAAAGRGLRAGDARQPSAGLSIACRYRVEPADNLDDRKEATQERLPVRSERRSLRRLRRRACSSRWKARS